MSFKVIVFKDIGGAYLPKEISREYERFWKRSQALKDGDKTVKPPNFKEVTDENRTDEILLRVFHNHGPVHYFDVVTVPECFRQHYRVYDYYEGCEKLEVFPDKMVSDQLLAMPEYEMERLSDAEAKTFMLKLRRDADKVRRHAVGFPR